LRILDSGTIMKRLC